MTSTSRGSGRPSSSSSDFKEKYSMGKLLGKGAFSEVYRATERTSGEVLAVKVIKKANLGKDVGAAEALRKEIGIMKELKHPNVVCVKDFFDTKREAYIVMDLAEGGELFDRIIERGTFTEADAARICKEIFEALHYLHKVKNVVHRDIKPENILCKTKDPQSEVMLSDFGLSFAENPQKNQHMQTACGTPGYCAPEILSNRSYSEKVDIWSVGIVCYILLCGYPPFSFNDDDQALFKQIKKGKYQFDSPAWDPISDDAKDFVSRLLVLRAKDRLSAAEALKHRWITGSALTDNIIGTIGDNLKKQVVQKKWRKVLLATRAVKIFEDS